MITRRRMLAISAAAVLGGGASAPVIWRGRAMGSDVAITLRHADAGAARATLDRARDLIGRMERLFSLHDPRSTLTALNRDGTLDPAPRAMLDLLAEADRVHRATGGLFDPTVQPLWHALAIGDDAAAARAALGWDRVRRTARGVTLAPGMALTLNGIAQGFAADRVADLLVAEGYGDCLVDLGELRSPRAIFRVQAPHGALDLAAGALATSMPGALILAPGQGHILGPSGQATLWRSVTVLAPYATVADGLSTALCLADLRAARAATQALQATAWLTAPDGSLHCLG